MSIYIRCKCCDYKELKDDKVFKIPEIKSKTDADFMCPKCKKFNALLFSITDKSIEFYINNGSVKELNIKNNTLKMKGGKKIKMAKNNETEEDEEETEEEDSEDDEEVEESKTSSKTKKEKVAKTPKAKKAKSDKSEFKGKNTSCFCKSCKKSFFTRADVYAQRVKAFGSEDALKKGYLCRNCRKTSKK